MSDYLLAAAVLAFLLGLVHSALGEIYFFRHAARHTGYPRVFGSDAFWKGTIRATWHTPSILGWTVALVLWSYARVGPSGGADRGVIRVIAVSMLACGLLWLLGTRARHPGWLAFLIIGGLCWAAAAEGRS